MTFDRKKHWEDIYHSKPLSEVSWYQPIPQISINFIRESGISKSAKIIDIGGGDSFLVDYLLKEGYKNITVLDISEAAIKRARQRLGKRADEVKWVVTDVAEFSTEETYDLWHDRAAFHFLTEKVDIEKYLETAQQSINSNGVLIMGTFSENGPKKCSGIEIKQYTDKSLTALFTPFFVKLKCVNSDHQTPFNTLQNFVFCSFRKK